MNDFYFLGGVFVWLFCGFSCYCCYRIFILLFIKGIVMFILYWYFIYIYFLVYLGNKDYLLMVYLKDWSDSV